MADEELLPIDKPVATMTPEEIQQEKKRLSTKLGRILNEYGGHESNVPARSTHEYWVTLNQLRALG